MKNMRVIKCAVGFLFSALASSCIPVFQNPLPGPSPDERIVGEWVSTNETGEVSLVYFFQRRNGWLDVVCVNNINSEAETNGVSVQVFEGYVSSVAERRFLCVKKRPADKSSAAADAAQAEWFLMVVDFPQGSLLRLTLLANDKIGELIEKGKLDGKVEKGKFVTTARVSMSGEALADAIRNEGLDAFVNEEATVVLRRGGPK